jgi:activator of 2-hydroxyglutaryl-CoA dehydratase
MLRDFEAWKESMSSKDSMTGARPNLEISISPEFEEVVRKNTNSMLDSLIELSNHSLKTEDGMHKLLSVKNEEAIHCFLALAEQTTKMAEEHIRKRPEVKCVCMTGVYSKVQEVQDSMKKCFLKRTLVIPSIPDLVVAKGAAYYGYTLYFADKNSTE